MAFGSCRFVYRGMPAIFSFYAEIKIAEAQGKICLKFVRSFDRIEQSIYERAVDVQSIFGARRSTRIATGKDRY